MAYVWRPKKRQYTLAHFNQVIQDDNSVEEEAKRDDVNSDEPSPALEYPVVAQLTTAPLTIPPQVNGGVEAGEVKKEDGGIQVLGLGGDDGRDIDDDCNDVRIGEPGRLRLGVDTYERNGVRVRDAARLRLNGQDDCDRDNDDVRVRGVGGRLRLDDNDDVRVRGVGGKLRLDDDDRVRDDVRVQKTQRLRLDDDDCGRDDVRVQRTDRLRLGGDDRRRDDLRVQKAERLRLDDDDDCGRDDVRVRGVGGRLKLGDDNCNEDEIRVRGVGGRLRLDDTNGNEDKIRVGRFPGGGGRPNTPDTKFVGDNEDNIRVQGVGRFPGGGGGRPNTPDTKFVGGNENEIIVQKFPGGGGGRPDIPDTKFVGVTVQKVRGLQGFDDKRIIWDKKSRNVIDIFEIGTAQGRLLKGNVIEIKDCDNTLRIVKSRLDVPDSIDCLRLERIVAFYGRIYAVSQGNIYVLNSETFNGDVWLWTMIEDWPHNTLDMSVSYNGKSMWISSIRGGYLTDLHHKITKVSDRPYIRRLGNTVEEYVEILPSGLARVYIHNNVREERHHVRDAILDLENSLHVVKADNTEFRGVRLINLEVVYF